MGDHSDFPWPRKSLQKRSPSFNLEELAPGLFIIDNVFTPDECHTIIEGAKTKGLTPTNPRNLPPKRGEAFRNNERLLFRDESFANFLFQYLKPIFCTIVRSDNQVACGLNPDFRIYRYVKGMSFGPHVDEPVRDAGKTMESEFTLLLYLSGEADGSGCTLRGGATRFYLNKKVPIDVQPICGRLLLHWTGHDCLHEGLLVHSGEKYLLRTDVFFPLVTGRASGVACNASIEQSKTTKITKKKR